MVIVAGARLTDDDLHRRRAGRLRVRALTLASTRRRRAGALLPVMRKRAPGRSRALAASRLLRRCGLDVRGGCADTATSVERTRCMPGAMRPGRRGGGNSRERLSGPCARSQAVFGPRRAIGLAPARLADGSHGAQDHSGTLPPARPSWTSTRRHVLRRTPRHSSGPSVVLLRASGRTASSRLLFPRRAEIRGRPRRTGSAGRTRPARHRAASERACGARLQEGVQQPVPRDAVHQPRPRRRGGAPHAAVVYDGAVLRRAAASGGARVARAG